jgi:hypothetical protein
MEANWRRGGRVAITFFSDGSQWSTTIDSLKHIDG